ncbi:3-oxoacyl-[acyl-carrier-protein] synthase III C-terminal domain-containing protein [Oerskovia sp. M15]
MGSEPELTPAVLIEAPDEKFVQDGRAVFRWAITRAADRARAAVERSGLTLDDIEVLVAHQANLRIIEPLAKALGLEDKVVVTDITESGNTSAASIPLGLSKWWHSGRIPAGVPALLIGFGGGFAWAARSWRRPGADRAAVWRRWAAAAATCHAGRMSHDLRDAAALPASTSA